HDLVALELGLEGAAYAAVGAGGNDRVFGLAHHDHGFLDQGGSGAGLYAGAARDAVAIEEGVVLARRHARGETLAVDGKGESALDLVAGAHAAAAHDALGRVVVEIG